MIRLHLAAGHFSGVRFSAPSVFCVGDCPEPILFFLQSVVLSSGAFSPCSACLKSVVCWLSRLLNGSFFTVSHWRTSMR